MFEYVYATCVQTWDDDSWTQHMCKPDVCFQWIIWCLWRRLALRTSVAPQWDPDCCRLSYVNGSYKGSGCDVTSVCRISVVQVQWFRLLFITANSCNLFCKSWHDWEHDLWEVALAHKEERTTAMLCRALIECWFSDTDSKPSPQSWWTGCAQGHSICIA